jgi:hypothetical protein
MRYVLATLGVLLLFVVSGCDAREEAVPLEGHFSLGVETIVEDHDLVIYRLSILVPGKRWVGVYEGKSQDRAVITPGPGEELGRCTVLIVADVVRGGDDQRVKWLIQIQGSDVTAGGATTLSIAKEDTISGLLTVTVKPGDYALGSEVDLAVFQGKPVRLKVE